MYDRMASRRGNTKVPWLRRGFPPAGRRFPVAHPGLRTSLFTPQPDKMILDINSRMKPRRLAGSPALSSFINQATADAGGGAKPGRGEQRQPAQRAAPPPASSAPTASLPGKHRLSTVGKLRPASCARGQVVLEQCGRAGDQERRSAASCSDGGELLVDSDSQGLVLISLESLKRRNDKPSDFRGRRPSRSDLIKGVAYFSNGERRKLPSRHATVCILQESALPPAPRSSRPTRPARGGGTVYLYGALLICEPVTYPKCLRFR
ncbi:hypothetical protein EVAR_36505_1 [Eumeta japonica]|uniref:Uncharacterized protein n=1 Tax=Eumeta variegata TaxID=151549 RepID=A0A4C1SGT6_EUMVA|nr:hypothetical protein EVAR_36505_1 [Eumeta japonica]